MEIEIGAVADYYAHIGVIALEIKQEGLKVGDKIHVKGHTTDFYELVESMQIEHQFVQEAKPGDSVGIKVQQRARRHDKVYKVIE